MPKSTKTLTQRGQSKPKGELARFIEIANLNSGQPLPYPSQVFDSVVLDPDKAVKLKDFWVAQCEEIASAVSPEVRAYLGSTADVKKFAQNYAILHQATTLLRAIANRKWPASQTTQKLSYEELEAIESARMGHPMCQATVHLVADKDGKIEISKGPVLESLVGIRAADRIKSCVICGRIFWAPRINSECCSLRCKNTFNQRNSRANRHYSKQKKQEQVRKGH